jgi:hypothetical protein
LVHFGIGFPIKTVHIFDFFLILERQFQVAYILNDGHSQNGFLGLVGTVCNGKKTRKGERIHPIGGI